MLLKHKRIVKGIFKGVGVYLGFCSALAFMIVFPMPSSGHGPPNSKLISMPGRTYPVNAFVSQNLAAGKPIKRVVILVHGLGGSASEWNKVATALNSKGIETISLHTKGHGVSTSKGVAFGRQEKDEIIFAARWARERTTSMTQVVVVGRGMGASSAWLCAAEHPEEIDGIVSESCFQYLKKTSNGWLDSKVPFGHLILSPAKWIGAGMARSNPDTIRPIQASSEWSGRPCLIVQPENDSQASRIDANKFVSMTGGRLWIVPKAEPSQIADKMPAEYAAKIASLFR